MITIEAKDWNKAVTSIQDFAEALKDLEVELRFAAEASYSHYQEHGTYKMPAHPYFYDNFDELANKIQSIFDSGDPTRDKITQAGRDTHEKMKSDAPYDTGHLRDNITYEER